MTGVRTPTVWLMDLKSISLLMVSSWTRLLISHRKVSFNAQWRVYIYIDPLCVMRKESRTRFWAASPIIFKIFLGPHPVLIADCTIAPGRFPCPFCRFLTSYGGPLRLWTVAAGVYFSSPGYSCPPYICLSHSCISTIRFLFVCVAHPLSYIKRTFTAIFFWVVDVVAATAVVVAVTFAVVVVAVEINCGY